MIVIETIFFYIFEEYIMGGLINCKIFIASFLLTILFVLLFSVSEKVIAQKSPVPNPTDKVIKV